MKGDRGKHCPPVQPVCLLGGGLMMPGLCGVSQSTYRRCEAGQTSKRLNTAECKSWKRVDPASCRKSYPVRGWGGSGWGACEVAYSNLIFAEPVIVPHAHWEAYRRGGLPLPNLVSDSANPHTVSDPLPQSFVGSSQHWQQP